VCSQARKGPCEQPEFLRLLQRRAHCNREARTNCLEEVKVLSLGRVWFVANRRRLCYREKMLGV
jgi:hypothetical protein